MVRQPSRRPPRMPPPAPAKRASSFNEPPKHARLSSGAKARIALMPRYAAGGRCGVGKRRETGYPPNSERTSCVRLRTLGDGMRASFDGHNFVGLGQIAVHTKDLEIAEFVGTARGNWDDVIDVQFLDARRIAALTAYEAVSLE